MDYDGARLRKELKGKDSRVTDDKRSNNIKKGNKRLNKALQMLILKLPCVRACDVDAVIRERDDSGPRLPDEEETLAGDERVGGGQLLLLLHRRPHREHLGSLHHCEHNLHRFLSGKKLSNSLHGLHH